MSGQAVTKGRPTRRTEQLQTLPAAGQGDTPRGVRVDAGTSEKRKSLTNREDGRAFPWRESCGKGAEAGGS